MLSSTSRLLTRLMAVLYGVLGLILFLTPESSSTVFAWRVAPFSMMTIGAWCLGNAVHAWDAAQRWDWSVTYPSLVYLWAFGLLQGVVLVAFSANMTLNGFQAWLYLAALLVNVIAAVLGIIDAIRLRPQPAVVGAPVAAWVRVATVAFVGLAAFIAFGTIIARAGGAVTQGGFFPDQMTLFTVRAFGAFYAAVGIGAIPLIWARGMGPILGYGRNGIAFVVTITAAALFYFNQFDFATRPGGAFYLGVYVVLFIGAVFLLLRDRSQQGSHA